MSPEGYSTHQMDDFYSALSGGHAKSSGIMNYIQHRIIADRARDSDRVADLCCGRGLFLPILRDAAPSIASYVGIDVSEANLHECESRLREIESWPFPIELRQMDIAKAALGKLEEGFDVVAYTSSIEHMPRQAGLASIEFARGLMAKDAVLFLSTPITRADDPIQYKVHVYEWSLDELEQEIVASGLEIKERIGLLPPKRSTLRRSAEATYGDGAKRMLDEIRARIPDSFADTVLASCFPVESKEVLLVCTRS